MNNSSISGLELFQMPFGSNHVSRQPQAARHHDSGRQQQHPTEAQSKAPQQQSGHPTAVHPTEAQKPAEQAAKPTVAAEYKPDITPSKRDAEEIKRAIQAAEAKDQAPVEAGKTQTDLTAKQPSAAKPKEQTETQQKELVLDMSSGSVASGNDKSGNADETAKRKAHEAAEAKRKAEWEAAQQAKKQKRDEALQKIKSMSDADIIAESTKRISTDVERITRRNMKECVAEHIQALCRKDPAFARLTMHPRKSMINCFKYINRQAKEFILQEMEENGIPKDSNGYGSDVPDGLCYQWAEDYFHDADAPEDTEKEEKFVQKPYTGTASRAKSSASKTKKPAKKKEEKRSEQSGNYEQMTLGV